LLYAVALGYYLLRGQQGMGGGDIKLLAMIGAATGVKGVHSPYLQDQLQELSVASQPWLSKKQATPSSKSLLAPFYP
jgi:prepilin signal peptidase PulO-like enzyme (type II secretory pathway)